jgi:PHD/YefM family antitoxin component YafN of YafNO toxin-antitoxin module
MAKEPRRIAIGPETDLLRVLEEVHADKEPRVVEKEGEAIAAIISMEDFATALGPSEEGMAMALAGAWKDLNTDSMVEAIYRARHESPPSTPVRL